VNILKSKIRKNVYAYIKPIKNIMLLHKQIQRLHRISFLCLFLFTFTHLSAQEKWTSLFNGKDLSGWKQVNGQAKYSVENGEIVGTSVAGTPNSFLITEKTYGDFILELEFKIDPGINSGIQFRSEQRQPDGRVHGYQMEIDHSDRAWSGGIYDEARRGWLYDLDLNPEAKKAYRPGEWNTYRIACIGTDIRTWVNGVPAVHLQDELSLQGFIGLQVHSLYKAEDAGKQVRWRNIHIQTKNLKAAPASGIYTVCLLPNQISESEKKDGWQLLWDGKSTGGWRSVYGNTFPEKGWKIEDNALKVISTDGSETGNDIVTRENYGPAFDLRFEFQFTEGANSGLKYFVDEKHKSGGKSGIGLEYQILDDARHPDAKQGVVGNRTMGSLYDLIPSHKFEWAAARIGHWNQGRIVSYVDGKVEHYLNNIKIVEYQRGSPTYKVLVARSKYADYEGFGMASSGPILLQDHGSGVAFRSLRIRRLEK
jgi:hypothetical protein